MEANIAVLSFVLTETVQANWRITFTFENDKVESLSIEDVNFEDYH